MGCSRKHWSYSALNQYLRCPLQYYFERVLKLPKLTVNSGLVLGGAIHEALAHYHIRLQKGVSTNISHLERVFAAAWKSREFDQFIQYKTGESRASQMAIGIELLNTYLQEPTPPNILFVERELTVPLINSAGEFLETPLVAVLDLVTLTEEGLQVHEIKTSGRAYGQSEVDTSLQASCYAHAADIQFAAKVAFEFTVMVKTKQPKLQRITTERTEKDFGRLGDLVQMVERAVLNEIYYPIESPLNCTGCPFRGPCREWQSQPAFIPSENLELNGAPSC